METADTLKQKLGCKTDGELGSLFDRGDKAVSAWRTKGLPAAIEKRARELMLERGIISEPETPYAPAPVSTKKPSQLFIEGLIATFNDEQLKEAARAILEVEAREDLRRSSSQ